MHRIGIIPFDIKDKAIAVLFVTSQTRGRWILPKGLAQPDETHEKTCHREGFEEAGVKGKAIMHYPLTALIGKTTDAGIETIPVTYYPYFVKKQVDKWPDMDTRQRHWALIEDAQKVAYREDLLDVIKQFEALLPWIKEAVGSSKS